MAKTKKELLEEAKSLGIDVDEKSKVAEIHSAIEAGRVAAEESSANQKTETAKAGKRSAKALKEVAEKQAKEDRKASSTPSAEAKTKPTVKPPRPKADRKGKAYRKSAENIDRNKTYSLHEAVQLSQKTSTVKFDATVELHVRLGVDPRHADQNIRDNITLPAGTGKSLKIAVLTDDAAAAKKAGADIAGDDDLLAAFDKNILDFDILIATPALMPKLGKYARVLGPKGLMPNPKSGTVTNDVAKAIKDAKAGRVEYRVDGTGIIHLGVGKVSFTTDQLKDNIEAVLTSVRSNKPQSIKGNYFKSVYLTTTMGPSVPLDISNLA